MQTSSYKKKWKRKKKRKERKGKEKGEKRKKKGRKNKKKVKEKERKKEKKRRVEKEKKKFSAFVLIFYQKTFIQHMIFLSQLGSSAKKDKYLYSLYPLER